MFTDDGRAVTLGVRGGGSNPVSMISVIMRIMCTLVIMWCNLYGESLFGDPLVRRVLPCIHPQIQPGQPPSAKHGQNVHARSGDKIGIYS